LVNGSKKKRMLPGMQQVQSMTSCYLSSMAKSRKPKVKRGEADPLGFGSVLVMERDPGAGARDQHTVNGYVYERGREWITNAKGVRERKTFYGKTRKELEEKIAAALAVPARLADVAKISLKDYLRERFLPGAKTTIRAATYSTYETAIDKHMIKQIGDAKFADFTADNARAWIKELQDAGIGPRAIQNAVNVLKRAYIRAFKDGALAYNPLLAVRTPKAEARDQHILTKAEVIKFLRHARSTEWGGLMYLAVALGMRQGELLGLTWPRVHLDDETPYVDVQEQVAAGALAPLKTKASKRRLYLDPGSVTILEQVRGEQANRLNPYKLVFPSKPKPPAPPKRQPRVIIPQDKLPAFDFLSKDNLTGRVLPTLLERAEVQIDGVTFHGLRHAGASLLASHRIPPSTIERWLGHSSKGITARYIHAYDDDLKDAASTMGTILAPVFGDKNGAKSMTEPAKANGRRKEKTRKT
jgi:integrase